MPNINEFLNKSTNKNLPIDQRAELIEGLRPCSKCDLYVDSYYFNNQTMEMYWTCKDGHQTKHKVG
jgi:hypothetical protein